MCVRHRHDAVGALVVAVVDVEPEHAAVVGEGVAVAADRQVLQHDRRAGLLIDGAEAPADARRILHGGQERQRHLAVEERVADRVLRRADVHARRGQHVARRAWLTPATITSASRSSAALLDLASSVLGRAPARRVDRARAAPRRRRRRAPRRTSGRRPLSCPPRRTVGATISGGNSVPSCG